MPSWFGPKLEGQSRQESLMNLLPLIGAVVLAPLTNSSQANVYQVESVDRTESFAGRLGTRVVDTLTLKGQGESLQIHLSRQHTRCGPVMAYQVGDRVAVTGAKAGATIMRDQVRRVQN